VVIVVRHHCGAARVNAVPVEGEGIADISVVGPGKVEQEKNETSSLGD